MAELAKLKKSLNQIKTELNSTEGVTWDYIERLVKGMRMLTRVLYEVVTYLESQTSQDIRKT